MWDNNKKSKCKLCILLQSCAFNPVCYSSPAVRERFVGKGPKRIHRTQVGRRVTKKKTHTHTHSHFVVNTNSEQEFWKSFSGLECRFVLNERHEQEYEYLILASFQSTSRPIPYLYVFCLFCCRRTWRFYSEFVLRCPSNLSFQHNELPFHF